MSIATDNAICQMIGLFLDRIGDDRFTKLVLKVRYERAVQQQAREDGREPFDAMRHLPAANVIAFPRRPT
jgi:hypothetical protein